VIGNSIFCALLVPSVTLLAWKFGAVGTGIIWCFANVAFLVLWVPRVHAFLKFGNVSHWFIYDVLLPSAACLAAIWLLLFLLLPQGWLASRFGALATCVIAWVVGTASITASCNELRPRLFKTLRRMLGRGSANRSDTTMME
jgi:hypothetical protein